MKRELLGLCTVATLVAAPAALAVDCDVTLFSDCIDNYATGDFIIGQDCGTPGCDDDPSPATCIVGNRWASWDNATGGPETSMVVADPGPDNDPVIEADSAARNPATSEDLVMEVNNLFPGGLQAGKAYKISADVYVPSALLDCACDSYYIILNTYSPNGTKNWSTQVHWNSSGAIISDFDDGVQNNVNWTPDEWVEIETIIVVDTDTQIINYGGQKIVTKSWVDGVSGGGNMDVEAWDLYPNDADVPVYYDNLKICEIDPVGACCHDDGSCDEGVLEADCIASGDRGGDPDGYFLGIGSSCDCDPRGDNGWAVDAPLNWDGSGNRAMGSFNGPCVIFGGTDDDNWVVTIPWSQEWFFDACNFGDADTAMTVGTTFCGQELGFNDDNTAECGAGSTESALRTEVNADTQNPVYVTIEEELNLNPDFTFSVTAQCPRLAATPGAIPEDELCGEDTNGGCNMDVPAFIDIECGDTIRGTHWSDGGARDTDWYQLNLDEDTTITITGDSVFAGAVFGYIQDSDQQNCDVVQFVSPLDTTGGCLVDPRQAVVEIDLAAGGHWLFSAPSFGGPVRTCSETDPDGQNGFTFTLECGGGAPCPADFDNSGDVGFTDLVTLLANWGPCDDPNDCPWDLDGNDDVGFNDLLSLLAAWGPCP